MAKSRNTRPQKKPLRKGSIRTTVTKFKTFVNKFMPGVSPWDIAYGEGYINDGKLNDFPQYLADITYKSPTTTAALQRFTEFVTGAGVNPDLKDVIINSKGMTFQEFHKKVANDFAYLRRIAIKVKPEIGGNISEISPIPVEWVRWGEPDEDNNIHHCVVNPFMNTFLETQKKQILPLWEGDAAKKRKEISKLGKEKYKGHILFFNLTSQRNRIYSRPDYFSSEQYINVDYKSGLFYDKYTANNFFSGGIINVFGDPDQGIENKDGDIYTTVGDEFNDNLAAAIAGVENSGGMILNWLQNDDQPTTFEPFITGNSHELFATIDGVTTEKICIAMGVPKVLLPLPTTGKLGDTQEIRNAILFLNERTENLRKILEGVYRKLFENMPNINIPDDQPIILPIGVFTDLPDTVFNSLKPDQKEIYLQKQFGIEPSEMPDQVENVEQLNNKLNGLYN